jgi:RND family efflux transporter MFP subunit
MDVRGVEYRRSPNFPFPQPAMKSRSYFAETLAIVCVIGLSGCEQKSEHAAAPPPEVLVTDVVKADVPIVHQWVGTLNGSDNADIRARVTGYLQKRNYQEGSFVKEGDALFEIDPRPFEAALAQAKSDVAQAQAVQAATEAQFERNEELFSKKVISVQEYENTRQLNLANVAKVDASQAALETAQLNLGFTKIVAPFDGIAGISQAQIGDLVGPSGSTSTLTTESKIDPIRLYFPISEREYREHSNLLRDAMNTPDSGRQATIEMLFADGTVYPQKGTFSFVNRQVDPTTGTILIAANFPNPDRTLRPGQFAVARAAIENIPGALLVPERALVDLQGNYQLGVLGADNKADIRAVKIGPRYNRNVVVTEGLKEGEKVIVEGMQKVRPGMAVNAKPYEEPKADTADSRRLPAEPKPPTS